MNWNGKKVFVTGAGGFIGSHLVERLVKKGARVTAFVRYNSRNDYGHLERLPPAAQRRVRVITGDLRDSDSVLEAMRGAEIVFHLGALISIPYSYVNPQGVVETNVMGTYNVLQAARRLKVKRVVHTSTSEVYGTAREVPISERHPLQAQSPYSASKIAADKIAESFYCAYEVPVVTVRPFNTYGPRQSARAVIPTIITQALKGGVIRLGSLHPTRDFTFVTDTVEGFIKAAEASGVAGETINLGTGEEISIGDLVALLSSLMGCKIKVKSDAQRKRPRWSEVERLMADSSRARQLLGWAPRVSLRAGLRKTIAWIEQNLSDYKPDLLNI